MKKIMICRGFSLVELMVAVSIFAVGTVFILRSFLTIASTLDSLQNRIQALQVAQAQINTLEEEALKGVLIASAPAQEEVTLNNRSAIKEVEVENLEEEGQKKNILKASVSLKWQEAGRDKDAIMVTYLENKK